MLPISSPTTLVYVLHPVNTAVTAIMGTSAKRFFNDYLKPLIQLYIEWSSYSLISISSYKK